MIRSVTQAYKIIHEEDKESAITMNTIRNWCKEGKIRSFKSGNRILVDVDSLKKYILGDK